MTSSKRARRVPLSAEVALAFAAGAASFALVAVALAVQDSDALTVVLGAVCVVAVVTIARTWGIAYAVPAAMAGLLAYDWFQFPPTHPHEFPDATNLSSLLVYLGAAALIGELAAYGGRRADVSEEARSELDEEQAALRRVATLVARGVPPDEVFAAVAREVGQLLGVDATHIGRYEPGNTAIGVASWSLAGDHIPVGTRATLDGTSVLSLVSQTGRPARMDSYDDAPGSVAERLRRELGARSSVGAPIVVEGSLWGVVIASSKRDQPLPADTESRIAAFTELVATAIANAEARTEVSRLVEEQAALRRVATLVAQGVPPSELFRAVIEEVGTLLDADLAGMIRYEPDNMVSVVATWAAADDHPDVPDRWPMEEGDAASLIAKTRQPARIDDWSEVPGPLSAFIRDEAGISSSVGGPILVGGRLWGALAVHLKKAAGLPADTEARLENFTELVATAISNAQARAEVHRLADEQAALRRVATLVARESPPATVFAAVAEEVGRLLPTEDTAMLRYGNDGSATVVASWGNLGSKFEVGTRMSLGGANVTTLVHRTGQSARIENYSVASGEVGERVRELGGTFSAAGCPIFVEGRLWGVMVAAQDAAAPLPATTESRVAQFTELVATAIANMQAREDLAASRARIVAATDEERRRVVRDLHDGAQQRLVHTVVTLKLARDAVQDSKEEAPELVTEALAHAEQANAELRELAHGILPAVLTRGGLRAGVDALASRMTLPVENKVSVGRLPAAVEATAYFVVSEALTNVAKHARAGHAAVATRVENGTLCVDVHDDGVGGARPDGSGLTGLADRLAVLDGRLEVESPAEGGTLVAATIPLAAHTLDS